MRVLVTGVAGQLGHDVIKELARRGIDGIGSDLANSFFAEDLPDMTYVPMDITCREDVEKTVAKIRPDVVVHCAAWTAVDAAEEEENREKVFAINAKGTEYLAKICKDVSSKMLYISTDYVFDGSGETPWRPDCRDYAPLSVYGASKLAGEKAVASLLKRFFIVRTAWVFGKNGNNFVKTMLRVAQAHESVRVVNDQIGTPTYTKDLARLLVDLLQSEKYGYYHATNEGGYISWYDFTKEIYRLAGADTEVIPVTTEEYGNAKAKRPLNSRLEKSKLKENGFCPLPEWKNALRRYLFEIGVLKSKKLEE